MLRVEATPDAGEDEFKEGLTLPLWRSKASVNLMLPKEDRRAMLLRIYNEDVELINHSDPKQNGGKDFKREPKAEQEVKKEPEVKQEPQGSIPAQADAEEVNERIKNEDVDEEMGGVPVDQATGLPATDLGAIALEQDAVTGRDQIETKRLEVLEDEDRKVAEAMPERAGDENADQVNKTV